MKCFGGVVVEGAPYAALGRAILAYQCDLSESELDDRWHSAEFAAQHFRKFGKTSERIWYQQKVGQFSSLDPAECVKTQEMLKNGSAQSNFCPSISVR
jgi:hypothetical protein